uniref:Uncharacterized protein n=1 Tax=Candidatus Kentrum sp. UNK TaxID=2126344 RepID=A0A451AVY8_9GAMM|nr:MAG: Uncharacterised protein family (UPF0150) [Candidatus Kentron sp. UNK]VFK70057.1 MAG: Uncharacterised protein family (UPF0150) [Candidatus Kentron sp. UNK]
MDCEVNERKRTRRFHETDGQRPYQCKTGRKVVQVSEKKSPKNWRLRKEHPVWILLLRANMFISSCHPPDVHSQGATRQEAIRNIEEALRFFIESCLERGTLEQVFRESRTFFSNLFISRSASQFEAEPR